MAKIFFLFPPTFRKIGIAFFIIGLILGIARFYFGVKPDMLDMKTFAIYSSYLQTKYMEFVRNNMAEEFTGFFLLTGLFMFAFSREKEEKKETNLLRLKAFFWAFYINFVFLAGCLFLTYGLAFVYMLMLNMGIGLFAYIVVFRVLLYMNRTNPPDS
jgi:hypothetical protein